MDWRKVAITNDENLDTPDTWLFPHYYDALNVLFRVENALRLFVYAVLKERYGPKWTDLEISNEDQGKSTIGALARRRIEQWKTFGYLTYPIQSPLMHLTSGELVGLITHDSYWPIFKNYFPGARSVVTLKLQEVGTVRNALAHFRPVSENDVEIVKQNANQMLANVEGVLSELIECSHPVPTNTESGWYEDLRTLGSEHVAVKFSQSGDESWVRVALRYQSVVLNGALSRARNVSRCRLTTVDTPAIVEIHQCLKDHVLCATEQVHGPYVRDDLSLYAQKSVCLTFSRTTLSEAHNKIKEGLESVLRQIEEETDLLREDQLARGRLVLIASTTARRVKREAGSWWGVKSGPLKSKPPSGELPEYWGRISAGPDFISDTEEYPWMPVKVCPGTQFPF